MVESCKNSTLLFRPKAIKPFLRQVSIVSRDKTQSFQRTSCSDINLMPYTPMQASRLSSINGVQGLIENRSYSQNGIYDLAYTEEELRIKKSYTRSLLNVPERPQNPMCKDAQFLREANINEVPIVYKQEVECIEE